MHGHVYSVMVIILTECAKGVVSSGCRGKMQVIVHDRAYFSSITMPSKDKEQYLIFKEVLESL